MGGKRGTRPLSPIEQTYKLRGIQSVLSSTYQLNQLSQLDLY